MKKALKLTQSKVSYCLVCALRLFRTSVLPPDNSPCVSHRGLRGEYHYL